MGGKHKLRVCPSCGLTGRSDNINRHIERGKCIPKKRKEPEEQPVQEDEVSSSQEEPVNKMQLFETTVEQAAEDVHKQPSLARTTNLKFAYGATIADEVIHRESIERIKQQFEGKVLWQQQRQMLSLIIHYMQDTVSERIMLIFEDVLGNIGKTFMCSWIQYNQSYKYYTPLTVPDTRYHSIATIRDDIQQSKLDGKRILLLVNLKRAYIDKDLYNLETICDGVWPTGYQSKSLITVKPKIVVMCNDATLIKKTLSADRLRVWKYDQTRKEFVPPEPKKNPNPPPIVDKSSQKITRATLGVNKDFPEEDLELINSVPVLDEEMEAIQIKGRNDSELLRQTETHSNVMFKHPVKAKYYTKSEYQLAKSKCLLPPNHKKVTLVDEKGERYITCLRDYDVKNTSQVKSVIMSPHNAW